MLKLYIVKNGKSLQNGKYICPLHVIRPSMRIWQFENKYVILQANKLNTIMSKGNNNDNQVRESGNGQLNESHGGGGNHGTPDFGPDKRRD